jgi:hypothetical protein
MTDPKHDLEILFGDAEEPLIEDLGIPLPLRQLPRPLVVEIAAGDTYYFKDWYDARAAITGHRPRVLPHLSPERPIYWWYQPVPGTTWWAVIEFTLAGEEEKAQFSTASKAYECVLSLRHKEKQRRLFEMRRTTPPKQPVLPQPPYRCVCRMVFDTAEELLAHRHWPKAKKESP